MLDICSKLSSSLKYFCSVVRYSPCYYKENTAKTENAEELQSKTQAYNNYQPNQLRGEANNGGSNGYQKSNLPAWNANGYSSTQPVHFSPNQPVWNPSECLYINLPYSVFKDLPANL